MTMTIGRLADRLLGAIVPKTSAGACACNDYWCTDYYGRGCPPGKRNRRCHASCDCSKVTCAPCGSC
jgi:hypothetical protein